MAVYLKPDFPPLFFLIDERGWDDGPLFAKDLGPSTLPGKPWVIAMGGRPKIFRVVKQEGATIWTEDSGRFEIQAVLPGHEGTMVEHPDPTGEETARFLAFIGRDRSQDRNTGVPRGHAGPVEEE